MGSNYSGGRPATNVAGFHLISQTPFWMARSTSLIPETVKDGTNSRRERVGEHDAKIFPYRHGMGQQEGG